MHVSGMQTSLHGVAASKVIVSIGETNKNLKGMIKNIYADSLFCAYGFMMLWFVLHSFYLLFKGNKIPRNLKCLSRVPGALRAMAQNLEGVLGHY